MSFLEGVRIGEARHVYSWGNPDEADPDENVCHVSLEDVCHVWGEVPTGITPQNSLKGKKLCCEDGLSNLKIQLKYKKNGKTNSDYM